MPLPIDRLIAFGLAAEVVEVWKKHGVTLLMDLQEKALAECGFLHGKNLLACAPTSSGKTFIAEIAALKHIGNNKRAIYMVPTKALAEEKYRSFRDLYAPLGYRIAVATRERPHADHEVLEGRYDLLVAVYEKMKAYLVTRPEMLSDVALIVADEIQMLGEPSRGATMDLLLTTMRRAPYATQFIGLSAVLGEDAMRVASWLGCDLLQHSGRPVELREGVFDASSGRFHYRCCNSGQEGDELLAPALSGFDLAEDDDPFDSRRRPILDLALYLAQERNEQVLIFVPTRYLSRNWAHHLASASSLPPAGDALEEIASYEENHARDLLMETMGHGIAFHNADLSWDLRHLIETHFNTGDIRILLSTSTLGQGVNLAGRNVIHVSAMVGTDPWTGRNAMRSLSKSRFRNQGGRAARLHREAQFGRSILIARNSMEVDRLRRDYIEGKVEQMEPQLRLEEADAHILDLIAAGVMATPQSLAEIFLETFSGRTLWRAEPEPVIREIQRIIDSLIADHLLLHNERGRLEASGIGLASSAAGLQIATTRMISRFLRERSGPLSDDPLELLMVLAATPDGRDGSLGGGGFDAVACIDRVRQDLAEQGRSIEGLLAEILMPPGGLSPASAQDARKALLLREWIGPLETREIEMSYSAYCGTIANLAAHFAWLVHATGAIAKALALPAKDTDRLETLGYRLVMGCPPEAVPLRILHVAGLCRGYLQALVREGCGSVSAIAEADMEYLASLMPVRVAEALHAEALRLTQPALYRGVSVSHGQEAESIVEAAADRAGANDDVLVEIDMRGTGRVLVNGEEVPLRPLAFRLFSRLARSPRIGVSYEELEQYVWPDAQVERQQLLAHRKQIVTALAPLISEQMAEGWIAVRRGRGLVLDLPAENIRLVGPDLFS